MQSEYLYKLVINTIKANGGPALSSSTPDLYNKPLTELGIDSMLALGIMNDMEEQLDIIVDDRQIFKLQTLKAIVDFLLKQPDLKLPKCEQKNEYEIEAEYQTECPSEYETGYQSENKNESGDENEVAIDPRRHHYLKSHCFNGVPFLPFAMSLEILFEEYQKTNAQAVRIELQHFRVENPILFLDKNAKNVLIKIENNSPINSAMLYKDSTHCYIKCLIKEGEIPSESKISLPKLKNTFLSNKIYEDILPHGEHFQCNFEIISFNADRIEVSISQRKPEMEFCDGKPAVHRVLNPVLIDGLFQVCGLHYLIQNNAFALPSAFELLQANLEKAKDLNKIFCNITRAADGKFNAFIYNDRGESLLWLQGLQFTKIGNDLTHAEKCRLKLVTLLQEKGFLQ